MMKNLIQNFLLFIIGSRILLSSSVKDVLLFVGITTGPTNLALRTTNRETWLSACIASPDCEHRFFIDIHENRISTELKQENNTFRDIVLRDFCDHMSVHPPSINYGNTGYQRNLSNLNTVDFYYERTRYKVDWKVCFSKYAVQSDFRATYHLYVEDDSFVHMRNLMFQLQTLEEMRSNGVSIPDFRTGFPKPYRRDGFDDSSTLMSRGVAETFASHYLLHDFHCSRVLKRLNHTVARRTDPKLLRDSRELAWGTSWRTEMCDWWSVLRRFGVETVNPFPDCRMALQQKPSKIIPVNQTHERVVKSSHCPPLPLVIHENNPVKVAAFATLNDSTLAPLLHSLLLLDVLKNETSMRRFEALARAGHSQLEEDFRGKYWNLSLVFIRGDLSGWADTLVGGQTDLSLGYPLGFNINSLGPTVEYHRHKWLGNDMAPSVH